MIVIFYFAEPPVPITLTPWRRLESHYCTTTLIISVSFLLRKCHIRGEWSVWNRWCTQRNAPHRAVKQCLMTGLPEVSIIACKLCSLHGAINSAMVTFVCGSLPLTSVHTTSRTHSVVHIKRYFPMRDTRCHQKHQLAIPIKSLHIYTHSYIEVYI